MDFLCIILALMAFAVVIGVLISRKKTNGPHRQSGGSGTRNPPQQN